MRRPPSKIVISLTLSHQTSCRTIMFCQKLYKYINISDNSQNEDMLAILPATFYFNSTWNFESLPINSTIKRRMFGRQVVLMITQGYRFDILLLPLIFKIMGQSFALLYLILCKSFTVQKQYLLNVCKIISQRTYKTRRLNIL